VSKAGIVLAGGFGTRFEDGEKTLAELDGKPLILHAVDALRPTVDTIVISCRDAQIDAFEAVLADVVYRPDPIPDEGPLAGLEAALDGLDAESVAVTTADRPCVPAELYAEFFDDLNRDGVVIQSGDFLEPAPAVFDAERFLSAVQRRHETGERRLRTVLDDLDLDTIPAEHVRARWGENALVDVNTRADLNRLRE
jgi:molybdopterin-guanine dinucleotide biosynthesis protein A